MITSYAWIGLLAGLVVLVGMIFGRRPSAWPDGDEGRLVPTLDTKVCTCLPWLLGVALAFLGRNETRADQLPPFYGLLLFLTSTSLLCLWYFHNRVVYWNKHGVGKRSLFGARCIGWEALTYAGRSWDDSFVLTSASTTIRYMKYDGGHAAFNDAIKRQAPRFASNF